MYTALRPAYVSPPKFSTVAPAGTKFSIHLCRYGCTAVPGARSFHSPLELSDRSAHTHSCAMGILSYEASMASHTRVLLGMG